MVDRQHFQLYLLATALGFLLLAQLFLLLGIRLILQLALG